MEARVLIKLFLCKKDLKRILNRFSSIFITRSRMGFSCECNGEIINGNNLPSLLFRIVRLVFGRDIMCLDKTGFFVSFCQDEPRVAQLCNV